jgi:hypothetical protein
MTYLVTVMNFEIRFTKDPTSKMTSKTDLFVLLSKTAYVFFFNFFTQENYVLFKSISKRDILSSLLYSPGSVLLFDVHLLCEVKALLQSSDAALGRNILGGVRLDYPSPALHIDNLWRTIHWGPTDPLFRPTHNMYTDLYQVGGSAKAVNDP